MAPITRPRMISCYCLIVIIKRNWNKFLLVLKATALKEQISNFYPQIQHTDASDHIYVSQWPKKGHNPHFSTYVYCGQTAGCIKMTLGRKVCLGPGHIVLDGDPALSPEKGHSPHFLTHVYCGQTVGQTVAHLSYC